MFECVTCAEDKEDDEAAVTPCCDSRLVCRDCARDGGFNTVVIFDDGWYRCGFCKERADPDRYVGILGDTEVARIRTHLAAQAPAPVVASAESSTTTSTTSATDLGTIQQNAWQFGAYTHSPGCGAMIMVLEGCDALKCPTCNKQVNVAGGEPGDHSGATATNFLGEARKFTARTDRKQLDLLKNKYPKMWASRHMDDLIGGVADGSLAGWPDAMFVDAWGEFPKFLTARVAPQSSSSQSNVSQSSSSQSSTSTSSHPSGPDQQDVATQVAPTATATITATIVDTSLFALLQSIDGDDERKSDYKTLQDHYHSVEATSDGNTLHLAPARLKTVNKLQDPQIKAAARRNRDNTAWWTS